MTANGPQASANRAQALQQRAANDLAALLCESPVDCGASGVWWRFTREPTREEAERLPPGVVVFVGANARGLTMAVTRKFVRRADGAPAPLDRMELSEQLRSGECVVLPDEVESDLPPDCGARLQTSLTMTPALQNRGFLQ